MTTLTFNVSTPSLTNVGAVAPGQPFMIDGEQDVYQAVGPIAGTNRPCRRMSDGQVAQLAVAAGALLVSIESATITAGS